MDSVSRAPISYWRMARSASDAVSTRSTLFPRLTDRKPARRASSISSALKPPSGPITRMNAFIPDHAGSRRTVLIPVVVSLFPRDQSEAALGNGAKHPLKRHDLHDLRDVGPAALAGGLDRDLLPPLPFARKPLRLPVGDGPLREEGDDPFHAQFRRVPDDSIHLLRLGDGLAEGDMNFGGGQRIPVGDLQLDPFRRLPPDERPVFPTRAVENPKRVALLHPKDRVQVTRLIRRHLAERARLEGAR